MSLLKNIYDYFEEGACALFVAVMVICLFLQVLMRITVGSSRVISDCSGRITP